MSKKGSSIKEGGSPLRNSTREVQLDNESKEVLNSLMEEGGSTTSRSESAAEAVVESKETDNASSPLISKPPTAPTTPRGDNNDQSNTPDSPQLVKINSSLQLISDWVCTTKDDPLETRIEKVMKHSTDSHITSKGSKVKTKEPEVSGTGSVKRRSVRRGRSNTAGSTNTNLQPTDATLNNSNSNNSTTNSDNSTNSTPANVPEEKPTPVRITIISPTSEARENHLNPRPNQLKNMRTESEIRPGGFLNHQEHSPVNLRASVNIVSSEPGSSALSASSDADKSAKVGNRSKSSVGIRKAMSVGKSTFRHSMHIANVKTLFGGDTIEQDDRQKAADKETELAFEQLMQSANANNPGANGNPSDPQSQKNIINLLLSNTGTARTFVGNEVAKYSGMTEDDLEWISKPVPKLQWFNEYDKESTLVENLPDYQRELGSPAFLEPYRKVDKKTNFAFLEADSYKHYFRDQIQDTPHENYISLLEDVTANPSIGPVVITVQIETKKRKGEDVGSTSPQIITQESGEKSEPKAISSSAPVAIPQNGSFGSSPSQSPTTEREVKEKDNNNNGNNSVGNRDRALLLSREASLKEVRDCIMKKESNKNKYLKVLIRTKKGTERMTLPLETKHKLKAIKMAHTYLLPMRFIKLKEPQTAEALDKDLVEYENKNIFENYKFGIIYCKEGQTEEDEMYNNKDGSPAFEEFLDFLGKRIPLEGFKGFRGGLDVKTNTTGTHSIYTPYRGFEIMFHVSTLLPYFPLDAQQVERKRHLGNDVVMIIFKEDDGKPFNPKCIHSHFTHVFIVVSPDNERKKGTYYKIAVSTKAGVRPFGPQIPEPASFKAGRKFREFLLTKCINGERASFYAPDFMGKLTNTRKTKLTEIVTKYNSQNHPSGQVKDGVASVKEGAAKLRSRFFMGSSS
eukprot:TRINITY_DN6548_c0_g1_i1.p1 TRINITY_DN6548_c0_g1~~TRINITY_DN6548_c0_g1_i1.p1  ORF type:complete len:910 (-),score=180.99 TRINITY_DN6548_c0_g1_i1:195-2924(-)